MNRAPLFMLVGTMKMKMDISQPMDFFSIYSRFTSYGGLIFHATDLHRHVAHPPFLKLGSTRSDQDVIAELRKGVTLSSSTNAFRHQVHFQVPF
jgi:hypothetical protein